MMNIDHGMKGEKITVEDFEKILPEEKKSMVEALHRRMLTDIIQSGNVEKFTAEYLEKGHSPNSLCMVYMHRWDAFTPDELRKACPPEYEVIAQVLSRDSVITRCREFAFDPESETAKHWQQTAPNLPMPFAKGQKIYTSTAKTLEDIELKSNTMTVVIFTHAVGSVTRVEVPEEALAALRGTVKTDLGPDEEPVTVKMDKEVTSA